MEKHLAVYFDYTMPFEYTLQMHRLWLSAALTKTKQTKKKKQPNSELKLHSNPEAHLDNIDIQKIKKGGGANPRHTRELRYYKL